MLGKACASAFRPFIHQLQQSLSFLYYDENSVAWDALSLRDLRLGGKIESALQSQRDRARKGNAEPGISDKSATGIEEIGNPSLRRGGRYLEANLSALPKAISADQIVEAKLIPASHLSYLVFASVVIRSALRGVQL
jgi:hypothetical protein